MVVNIEYALKIVRRNVFDTEMLQRAYGLTHIVLLVFPNMLIATQTPSITGIYLRIVKLTTLTLLP